MQVVVIVVVVCLVKSAAMDDYLGAQNPQTAKWAQQHLWQPEKDCQS